MDWNGNRPDVVGLEFVPQVRDTLPEYSITSPGIAASMRLPSHVTETISTLGVHVNAPTDTSVLLAEVLLAGLEAPTDLTTTVVRPNGVEVESGSNNNNVPSTAGSILTLIQRTVVAPTDTMVELSNTSAFSEFLVFFATAGLFTGRRIVDVRIVVACMDATQNSYVAPIPVTGHIVAGTFTGSFANSPYPSLNDSPNTVYTVLHESMGEINVYTHNTVWTPAAVQDFDVDSGFMVQYGPAFGGAFGPAVPRIGQMWMEVDHCAENRVAVDVVAPSAAGPRWTTYTPHKPDGTANFAKVASTDLTMVLRQARYGSADAIGSGINFNVPYILGRDPVGTPTGIRQYKQIALDLNGLVLSLGPVAQDRLMGWEMRVSGTQSLDAQPYCAVVPVNITGTVQQEIDQAAVGDYGGMLVPCRYQGTIADHQLRVQLKRRSDDVVMGTATISAADLDASPLDPLSNWHLVAANFAPPATLSASDQYYIEYVVTLGESQWYVPALSAVSPSGTSVTGLATYRGTTDVATYGGGDVSAADISVVAFTAPVPPTDLSVTPGSITTDVLDDSDCSTVPACDIGGIGYNHLTWAWDSLGGFSHFEIQRRDARTDWQPIAYITDRAVTDFSDVEARLGQTSCYRIRVVSHVGAFSDWSDSNGVCGTAPVGGLGLTFTANELPEGSVGYVDTADDATRNYLWDEANEDTERKMYGRDYVTVLRQLERRGARFTRTMVIGAFVTPVNPGPDAFDALRNLAKSAFSYVCVRDESGNRKFMSINVPESFDKGTDFGSVYTATVNFVEVTDQSSQPDVTVVVS